MKYLSIAVLALIGVQARRAPSARRLDTTLIKFVDEDENMNLDEFESQLGHQGKEIRAEQFSKSINEMGGQQEGGSYQAWRRSQKPELFDHDAAGKIKAEEYPNESDEYVGVGVRFVNYDDDAVNTETQKALNLDQMGSKGFLVSGGAFSEPSEYTIHQSLTA